MGLFQRARQNPLGSLIHLRLSRIKVVSILALAIVGAGQLRLQHPRIADNPLQIDAVHALVDIRCLVVVVVPVVVVGLGDSIVQVGALAPSTILLQSWTLRRC